MWYTELVCLFEYWVCILCLSYFTELVVSIGDFCTLGYLVHCYLKGILKMYTDISLNLFVTYDIFIAYFFVIRILFCVIDRISVCVCYLTEFCVCIFLWTYLLFVIFLLCTSLLYEFYFVLLTESVCFCCLTEFCICILALCALYSSCAVDIEKFKLDIYYCVDWDYTPICATELQKGYLFCLCLCHEGLFYFVTFLSQNFLFLFSGGEFVAVRSFWAFWKMGCLVFCRNSVLPKSWTILFCHKSIFWDWQFFSEFWLWLLFIL